ncbi:DUF2252 family protein [Mucilaginibacter ginkgonis]|uniref:DUF2252 family protein n=1 Tax=Mucilaginibacter ginkgonis TaxID=2682091 RepID=A0A7T7FBB0_9SPHI|nr:DUF2252 family protein [Mucilaginibacter ginkgonis]
MPDILRHKYAALADNPFRFFKSTCYIYYEDLAKTSDVNSSPLTWICGDLHLENFGSYRANNTLYTLI